MVGEAPDASDVFLFFRAFDDGAITFAHEVVGHVGVDEDGEFGAFAGGSVVGLIGEKEGDHFVDLEDFAFVDEAFALPAVEVDELLVLPIPGGHPFGGDGDVGF